MMIACGWFTRACAIALVLVAQASTAASFDCESASTAIEVGICGDETLSAADEEMARKCHELLPRWPTLPEEQAAWLRDVRNVCDDSECLSKVYLDRISALDEQLAAVANPAVSAQETSAGNSVAVGGSTCGPNESARWKQLLCLDSTLMAAEGELAGQLHKVGIRHPEVYQTQVEWERDVRDACNDTECLSSAYLQRIATLETYEQQVQPAATDDDIQSSPRPPNALDRFIERAGWHNIIIGVWVFVGFIFFILILGSSREVVICYNTADFLWTLAPIVFPLIGFMIHSSLTPEGTDPLATMEQRVVIILTAAAAAHSIIKIFYNACVYNRSIPAGIFVGCFKVFLGLLAALIILGSLDGSGHKNRHRAQPSMLALAVGLLILGWLFRAVFNGPAVYEKKGWQLQHV